MVFRSEEPCVLQARHLRPVTSSSGSVELLTSVLEALRSVVGNQEVALHEPTFGEREWCYLQDCLDSTFVSSAGSYVDQFESELASATGATHVVATVSGTAALQVALRLIGVGPGDEVLVPALTFVATANAVSYLKATPHFVDCESSSLGMDPTALREHLGSIAEVKDGICVNRTNGRVIRALVPVHVFGHPAQVEDLVCVASDFCLGVVEDAAESLGSTIRGRHTGTIGHAGVLSFNGNKIVTAGGGGAILTDDPELAAKARHLTTTAKVPHGWEFVHDEIGYNYRLPNINAALGCAQVEGLSKLLTRKRHLFDSYNAAFAGVEGIEVLCEPPECLSNYWLQSIRLDEPLTAHRNLILESCNSAGYGLRPVWRPLHWLDPYRDCPRADLPVTENLYHSVINLPSSAHLA